MNNSSTIYTKKSAYDNNIVPLVQCSSESLHISDSANCIAYNKKTQSSKKGGGLMYSTHNKCNQYSQEQKNPLINQQCKDKNKVRTRSQCNNVDQLKTYADTIREFKEQYEKTSSSLCKEQLIEENRNVRLKERKRCQQSKGESSTPSTKIDFVTNQDQSVIGNQNSRHN